MGNSGWDNDKQVIMDTDGGKSTLYAAGAY